MDSRVQQYMRRLSGLRTERSTWIDHWRDLAENISPRRFRYLLFERNRGWKKNQRIINGVGTWALRTLASGMMAGITSPARPWFRLTTADPDMAEYGPVRSWLDVAEERLRDALLKSNVYNSLHNVYFDLGLFGTAAMYLEEDAHTVMRSYVWPIGQYMLANSARLSVDSVFREFSMTVGQLVEAFGEKACSVGVQNMYRDGGLDAWQEVVHVIEPNREYAHGQLGPKGKRWRSCWFEKSSDAKTSFLREAGYDEFPLMAPRWVVTGEDVYGAGPGMDALGDAKALQLLERRKAQAMDKIVNPPMRAPMSLMNQRASLLPGELTYVPENASGQTFAPAVEIPPAAIQVAREGIAEHSERVKTAFYADLWLSLTNGEQGDMTAREVTERHEEKMLQLGPVMERLEDELLDPLIERALGILFRSGQIPPAPPETRGDVRIEYISIMAQAQRALGTSSIERLAGFAGNLSAVRPEVMDKLDTDAMIEEYADKLSIKSSLIVPDDAVKKVRAARAQQQQAQAQAAQAAQMAKSAQVLSQADVGSDNGLTRLLGTLPPAASGAAGGGQ